MRTGPLPPPRSFLRSGGWIVVAALVVTTVAFAWTTARVLSSRLPAPPGDGTTIASYGFTLTPRTVPLDRVTASGLPRDAIPVLDHPAAWTLTDLERASHGRNSKLLVPADRVVGIDLDGRARAYPLRFLAWHEVVNDTIGAVPLLVTYHPLSGSVAVFSRRVRGTTLTFGFSGLLYQSSPLLYDRQKASGRASLWSQLLQRAVAGPAAGSSDVLEVVPSIVTTWGT